MSFYTAYLPYILDDDFDWSYPSPEQQLLWRLDDLYDILDELKKKDAPYGNGYRLTDNDIRYAISEEFSNGCLGTVSAVERAIELAKFDLVNTYGLPHPDEIIFENPEATEDICDGQLLIEDCFAAKLGKAA